MFSKGPWHIEDRSTTISASFEIIPEKGMTVASVPAYYEGNLGMANARLIAASPKLLEAVKFAAGFVARHKRKDDGMMLHEELLEVIREAEGKG